MHRAFSFPVTLERSRTKERLEASLAGLCELELRKQRQECLVLGALALGDPAPPRHDPAAAAAAGGELSCFSSWGQENLTLRRQLSALQSSPWGLMQALEQQVGELRIDTDGGCCDGGLWETCDSRPSSGFYESSEGQSPKGRSCCAETSEVAAGGAACPWAFTNDRPKSVGDPLSLNGEGDAPVLRTTLPRSFSAPYPPLEGIAEEGPAVESWQWDPSDADGPWQQQDQHLSEGHITEEDYQQALRVESYIVNLIQRHTLPPRPCQPRTTLSPDPQYCSAPGYGSSLHRRTPSLSSEQRLPDPHQHPQVDLSANVQARGCDLLEGEVCGGEAPSLEEDCYLALPHPQCRPHSLAGGLPSPLPSLDLNCGGGALNLCEPSSPQHYLRPQPPQLNLVSAQYIPGQACHAPVRSPRHYNPEQPKSHRAGSPPDHPGSKSRASKKTHNERQRSKKSSSKTRSQSENSLLAQRVLPERRYSTTERRPGRAEAAQSHGPAAAAAAAGHDGSRRWCSNLELSQDEGEAPAEHGHRRAPRKVRRGYSCPYSQPPSHPQQQQRWHPDFQERAPLCRGEEGYAAAAPAESESSMSEVYSPASSSLSSDSDESGGLVWPQQLPPRLAATSSSSSSPSPQATANPPAQPKAFVKIKASHALKKKILRFRSGSLKVMTTV